MLLYFGHCPCVSWFLALLASQHIMYVDGMTIWGRPQEVSQNLSTMPGQLVWAGPAGTSIPLELSAGLIALGCSVDHAFTVAATLAHTGIDLSARQVAVVLLQRCVVCALDFDLRVCTPAQTATSISTLSAALQDALMLATATTITIPDMCHACRKADPGGLSIRRTKQARRPGQQRTGWSLQQFTTPFKP